MAAQNNEEKNLKKSIFSIDVSKGPRSLPMRKGTACAVKTEGSTRALLVTSGKVVEHGGSSTQVNLSSKRFCAKYPDHEDKHLVKQAFQLRNTEQFCFIPLQAAPKYCSKLVTLSKLRESGERFKKSRCLSFTFFGNTFKTLTWEFNEEDKTHELTEVHPKGDLVRSACRGSPVISTQDEDHSVIGVVDCNPDGDLYLMFFNESSLDIEELKVEVEDALDVTDSPVIPHESTPSAPPPQEPRAEDGNARDTTKSAGKRAPEENAESTPQEGGIPGLSRTLSNMGIQECNRSEEKKPPKVRTFKEEEVICIWNKEVQSLDSFQHLLTAVLKINLDPRRELGGDYRSIAGTFGKNMKYIWFLESKPSPIEELLKDYRPTLRLLQKTLLSEEVDRADVAKEITAWVEKEGCSCSKCGSLR